MGTLANWIFLNLMLTKKFTNVDLPITQNPKKYANHLMCYYYPRIQLKILYWMLFNNPPTKTTEPDYEIPIPVMFLYGTKYFFSRKWTASLRKRRDSHAQKVGANHWIQVK